MTIPRQQAFSFAAKTPRRKNLVIEAGAGTGKTTAIVAHVLERLLGADEIAPERIVLVTFTEKAAGEIGDRVEKAMQEIARQLASGDPLRWPVNSEHPLFEVPASQRESCRGALERQLPRIDRLRSQTIHSFCQTLLRQFPIEAGIDPRFRIIEGFERSLLYDQVYDDWIDDETRLHPRTEAAAEWEALLDHYGYLFRVQEAILLLVDRRHLLLDSRYDIGNIAEYEGTLRSAIDDFRRNGGDSRIAVYFRSSEPPPEGSDIDAWIDYFAPVAIDLRQAKIPDLRRCAGAIKTLRGKDTGSCVYDLLISHRAAAALLAVSRRFIARLDDEKRRRGVLDFDDLLLCTRRLLDNPPALERIRNQFDCLFVDEFQDTDRVQAEILDRLARDPSGAYVPGKTVVVGDPKQSIYAFRRADPETYARFTADLETHGGKREFLVDQWRSTPALVETLNAVGGPLFAGGDRDPNVFRPEYHDLNAALRISDSGRPAWTMIGCAPGAGDRAEREAEAVAAWILSRDHSDWRRYALLFRRRTNLDQYLEVLERAEIPCVVPPMGLFLDRPAAVDLMAVLRALAWRYDRGAAISAARTPYFALTDPEIASGLLEPGREPWKSFAESLEEFRRAARHLTITELIDHVVSATGIEAVYREMGDPRPFLRPLEQLRAIAFTYDQNSGGSVRQFVAEIARRRELPEEVEPSLLDESRDAVRVLTIHGAKGLEFDTVILPDIEFNTHGGGLDLFTVEEPRSLVIRNGLDTLSGVCRFSDNRPLSEIASLRDDAETRRLFYVAITRAKSEFAIVFDPQKLTRSGFGKYLRELGLDETRPSHLTIGKTTISIAYDMMSEQHFYERLVGNPGEPPAPCVVPRPVETVRELPPGEIAASRNASANRLAGILLHRVLERWDGRSDVAPLLALLAIEQAADERTAEVVRRRLDVVARSVMFRRIAAAETIGREMPVSFFDDSGTLVERRIDRLIREGDEDVVIDYKSGAPTEARSQRDRQQVGEYCRAVEKLTARRCSGVIWYIDVENDLTVEISNFK